jgi:HEAT repeat protein
MKTADSLARQHTERAIDTLVEVMDDPFAENRERITAANSLLDRGHGKPNQAIIAIPGNRQVAALLATKSDDELMALLQAYRLPRLAPIDATFTEHEPLLD